MHQVFDSPNGEIDFFTLHLESPREGFDAVRRFGWEGTNDLAEVNVRRMEEAARASGMVATAGERTIVVGDFNMPVESRVYRRHWSSLANGFSQAGLGLGYTKWTYTKTTGWYGTRIDHVLAGTAWRFRRCWVGPSIGPDHRGVIAEIVPASIERRP